MQDISRKAQNLLKTRGDVVVKRMSPGEVTMLKNKDARTLGKDTSILDGGQDRGVSDFPVFPLNHKM